MYIFIDSTEYSRFLAPEPDIKTLKAFLKLLRAKPEKNKSRVLLVITDQVLDEYYRAETQRTQESKEQHTKKEFEVKFDRLGKEQSKEEKNITKKINNLQSSFEKLRKEKLKEFNEKIEETKKVIKEIFSLAIKVDCDDKIFKKAEMRISRGMHPRASKESIGDAINWEIIMSQPDDGDYFLITKDNDFLDKNIDPVDLHKTLRDEWKANHKADLKIFQYLGLFIDLFKKPTKKTAKKGKTKKIKNRKKIETSIIETNIPSPGTETYVSKSIPLVSEDMSATRSAYDAELSSITFNGYGAVNRLSVFGNSNDVKCCPFCQADKTHLIEDPFALTYFSYGKKNYYCTICNRKFSV